MEMLSDLCIVDKHRRSLRFFGQEYATVNCVIFIVPTVSLLVMFLLKPVVSYFPLVVQNI